MTWRGLASPIVGAPAPGRVPPGLRLRSRPPRAAPAPPLGPGGERGPAAPPAPSPEGGGQPGPPLLRGERESESAAPSRCRAGPRRGRGRRELGRHRTAPGRHRTPAGTAPGRHRTRPAPHPGRHRTRPAPHPGRHRTPAGTARHGSARLGSARIGTAPRPAAPAGPERPRPPRRSGRVDLHSRARWVSPMDLYHLLAAWAVTGSGMKCEERRLAARSPSVGRCCVCSAPAPARHPVRLSSKSLGLFASSYLAILVRGNYSSLARRVLIGELQASVVDSHVEAEPRVLCCAPRGEAACGKASSQPCISHFVTLRTRRWKACESRRGRTPPAGSYYKLDGVRALDTWFIPRRGMG
ncbi:uncharacterized protein J5F26_008845 [Ciconia maguari]